MSSMQELIEYVETLRNWVSSYTIDDTGIYISWSDDPGPRNKDLLSALNAIIGRKVSVIHANSKTVAKFLDESKTLDPRSSNKCESLTKVITRMAEDRHQKALDELLAKAKGKPPAQGKFEKIPRDSERRGRPAGFITLDKAFGPCKDCKGTKLYQPLIGPPEPCQTCT